MKAKDLISILEKQHPEAEISIAWEEHVRYSELTSGTEDQIENVVAVYIDEGRIIISAECYIIAEKIWPIVEQT